MTKNEGKFYISLMGKNSHEVDIPAGQGSFSIAPKGYGDADAYVDADTPISWSAFDGMQIPAGGHCPGFSTTRATTRVLCSGRRSVK